MRLSCSRRCFTLSRTGMRLRNVCVYWICASSQARVSGLFWSSSSDLGSVMATPCRVSVTGCTGVGGGLCAPASAAAARVIVNTREIILPRIIEKWGRPSACGGLSGRPARFQQFTADHGPDLVQRTRSIFKLVEAQQAHLGRDLQQMPQFLHADVRRPQVRQFLLPVIRLDQVLQHIELDLHQPVSEQEFVVSRKFLDLRQEPLDEVVGPRQYVLLDRHTALLSPKNFRQGCALHPKGTV